MSDSRGAWGWGQPTPQAGLRRKPDRRGLLPFVLLGVLIVLVPFILLRGSGTPSGATQDTSQWTTQQGASVRSDFLAQCRRHGSSAAFCVCAFDEIRAEPTYSSPVQFAALDPESATPSAAASGALSLAAQSCGGNPATVPAPGPAAAPTPSPAGRPT